MHSSTHHMRDQEPEWRTLEECKLLHCSRIDPALADYISWLNANEHTEQDLAVLPDALGGA